jgi:hypothetical protein
MLCKKIIADYFDNYQTAINIVCGQKGGAYTSSTDTRGDPKIIGI